MTGLLPYREPSWERSLDAPTLDDESVARLLEPWPDLVHLPWRPLAEGLRSRNLQIGEDRVLRVPLSEEHDLAKEAALLRWAETRVRVPKVIGESSGALLLSYVPHAELPDYGAAGAAAGRAAARIHTRHFSESGLLGPDLEVRKPFPTALEGLFGWADECIAGAAGRTLGARVRKVRAAWSRSRDRLLEVTTVPVLLHGDFKPANVKWLPEEVDVILFDWEFAWAGPALMDVGQMFRWGASEDFSEGFEVAYRAGGGTLPGDWRRTAALLDLFNIVGLLRHESSMPVRDRDLMAAVDQVLARAR